MHLRKFLRDLLIAAGGLDAAVGSSAGRRPRSRAPNGNPVVETGSEQGSRFHVNGHDADAAQVSLERFVVFPDTAIGGVNRTCPVVAIMVADGGRDGLL